MLEATGVRPPRQEKPWLAAADVLTLLRLPLAALFALFSHPWVRLIAVLGAAATDVLDGIVARARGGSRLGAILDPVVDKLFMAVAFGVVWASGALHLWEILVVLLRDLVALGGLITVSLLGRPTALPARAGGKAVTVAQLLTLLAFVAGSDLILPLAWAAGAISLYAIADYTRVYKNTRKTGSAR